MNRLKVSVRSNGGTRHARALATLMLAGLSACSAQNQRVQPAAPPPAVAPAGPERPTTPGYVAVSGLNATRRIALVYDLLNQGRVDPARIEIARLLSDYPGDRTGADLLRQIDEDPKTLYGVDSFAYETKPGDTFAALASRYLGAGSRFYGLARYNGIAVPASLAPGQTIMIPGKFREPAPVREPRRPRAVRGAPAAAGTAPAPVAEAPRTDPVRAARLRRAGLERMAAGSIGRAVQLLQRAAALDPANAAIAGDLDRARRIQSSVGTRP